MKYLLIALLLSSGVVEAQSYLAETRFRPAFVAQFDSLRTRRGTMQSYVISTSGKTIGDQKGGIYTWCNNCVIADDGYAFIRNADWPTGQGWRLRAPFAKPIDTLRVQLDTIYQLKGNYATTGQLLTATGNISTLQGQMTTAQGNINSLQSTQTTQGTTISGLQSTQTSQGASITTLQGQASTASTNISALQSTQTTQGTSITTLQGQATTAASNIGALQSSQTAQDVVIASKLDTSKHVKFYTSAGQVANQPMKIWIDTLAVTANPQTINISSAGFTKVISVQLTPKSNNASVLTLPLVVEKSRTNTAVVANFLVSANTTVGILGTLVPGLVLATNLAGLSCEVSVIGY